MSKIGLLKPVGQGNREELHGEITTLQMQLKIKLIPNNVKTSDSAPDYIVCAAGYSGKTYKSAQLGRKERSRSET